jgi:hypothetical protein
MALRVYQGSVQKAQYLAYPPQPFIDRPSPAKSLQLFEQRVLWGTVADDQDKRLLLLVGRFCREFPIKNPGQ